MVEMLREHGARIERISESERPRFGHRRFDIPLRPELVIAVRPQRNRLETGRAQRMLLYDTLPDVSLGIYLHEIFTRSPKESLLDHLGQIVDGQGSVAGRYGG